VLIREFQLSLVVAVAVLGETVQLEPDPWGLQGEGAIYFLVVMGKSTFLYLIFNMRFT